MLKGGRWEKEEISFNIDGVTFCLNSSKSVKTDPTKLQLKNNKSVVAAVGMTNVCLSHLVLLNKRLKSLLVVGQAAVETQTLLGLRQPLQQDVDGGVELLRLRARGHGPSVSVAPPPRNDRVRGWGRGGT